MEKVWCGLQHAPSPALPRREPKSIHSDSVAQLSVHSSCQLFAVSFAIVCYQPLLWTKNDSKSPLSKRKYIQDNASPSSTSDASTTPLFKRTRALHSKPLTIQLDQILWTCTNASLRCHLSTTNRSSFASAVNESLHRLHCFHGLHRFHCLHGFHRRCLLLNGLLHRLHCFHCFHCLHRLHGLHGLHRLHRLHGLHGSHFGKCKLLRAGARLEPWKQKDMWLRLKCDLSAATPMTSSVVADSSCLQWKKYDVDFNMHHPRREPKPIHSDSVTELSLHSSRPVFVVSFASVCYQSKMISFFYSSDLHPENPFCHFWRIIWKYMWYCLIFFPSFLVFYLAFYLTFYSASILTSYLASVLVSILKFLWHSFWHSIWHLFWHSFWHLFWHSNWHSFLAFYLASILTFSLACVEVRHCPLHWDLGLGVRVRQCPLRSGGHGWRLAAPTQQDLELAVEVRQCPLRSGARGSGLAVGSEIWSSRLRSGSAHWNLELAVGR